jgi:hypothetical protein
VNPLDTGLQPGDDGVSGDTTAAPPFTAIEIDAVSVETYSGRLRASWPAAPGTWIVNVAVAAA